MKKIFFCCVISLYCLMGFSQQTGAYDDARDGKIYKTVVIGSQTWLAENLAYSPDRGIFQAGKWDSTYLGKCGYLYDWRTAKSVALLCWHLPSKEDWKTLYGYLGGNRNTVYSAMIEGGSSGFNAHLCGLADTYGFVGFENTDARYWRSSAAGIGGAPAISLRAPYRAAPAL
jgi:uncharacterized protein (TIGR02145 family)